MLRRHPALLNLILLALVLLVLVLLGQALYAQGASALAAGEPELPAAALEGTAAAYALFPKP